MMVNVIIVDNERIILEGISQAVEWERLGTRLAGTARNGIEAFGLLESERIDIVISDIRMPGMDGLQLVEQSRRAYPGIRFILLSGFNEFAYAQKAMQFGVRHYLLKPCGKEAIEQAIAELVEDCKRSEGREQFVQRIQSELMRVMPHAKEQLLKELVTNKTYGKRDWDMFKSLFNISLENQTVRLVLFQLEGRIEYEYLFALTNIAEDILGKPYLLLSTTIGQRVLLLVRDYEEEERLFGQIETIRSTFDRFYSIDVSDVTIALSGSGDITEARRMYRETLECLNDRFYLEEGGLITKQDIEARTGPFGESYFYDDEKLCMLIKSGRVEDVMKEIDEMFDTLAAVRMDSDVARSYVLTLFMAIARQGDPRELSLYMNDLARLSGIDTFASLRECVKKAAYEIALRNYNRKRSQHSSIIKKTLDIIGQNLGNPMLSLHWVAKQMLYVNADYLGKMFKKEVGDKFSNYVMEARMKKALELIGQMEDVKVFELAELLGFGDNPKYFGQVFKKYTGFSPSEYKKN
ncbi:response regulator [Paenibacillus tarimensis]